MFDFMESIQTPGTLAAGEAVKKMAAYYSVQFNGTGPAQKAERSALLQKLSMLLPQRDVWQLVCVLFLVPGFSRFLQRWFCFSLLFLLLFVFSMCV